MGYDQCISPSTNKFQNSVNAATTSKSPILDEFEKCLLVFSVTWILLIRTIEQMKLKLLLVSTPLQNRTLK